MRTIYLSLTLACAIIIGTLLPCKVGDATAIAAAPLQWQTSGPEGGDATVVSIAPSNPPILYAATWLRLFKSTDNANTWTRLNLGIKDAPISAIAIDPENSSVVYVGASGSGSISKSTDGGETWTVVATGWRTISLAIDPNDSNTIYAGTYDAILKSTDAGSSWTTVLYKQYRAVFSLAVDRHDSQTIYAGVQYDGAVKSTDGGRSWSVINNGMKTGTSIIAVATDSGNPRMVYAAGDYHRIYKSTDAGASWSVVYHGPDDYFSFHALVIDRNGQTIYAGGSVGMVRSLNGGRTWMRVNMGIVNRAVFVGTLAMNVNDSQTIYAGTLDFSGIYKSTDSGATWREANRGFIATAILSIAVDPVAPRTVYAVTRDGFFRSADDGITWTRKTNGLSGRLECMAPDPSLPGTVYLGTQKGMYRSTNRGDSWTLISGSDIFVSTIAIGRDSHTIYAGTNYGIMKSLDGGNTWNVVNNTSFGRLTADPGNSEILYTPNYSVYKSTDGGVSWRDISSGYFDEGVTQITVAPNDSKTIYAATTRGVYKSVDSGKSWELCNGLGDSWFFTVEVDPTDSRIVYAGDGGVHVSVDGGKTGRDESAGLPTDASSSFVRVLAIDPTDPGKIYAGTMGFGVYHTVVAD